MTKFERIRVSQQLDGLSVPIEGATRDNGSCAVRKISNRALASLLAMSLASCVGAQEQTESQDDIIGGSVEKEVLPGVLAFSTACTAIKVGTYSYVTAGHCLLQGYKGVDFQTGEPTGAYAPGQKTCVRVGLDVTAAPCTEVQLRVAQVHPSYAKFVQKFSAKTAVLASDNALDLAFFTVDKATPLPTAKLATRSAKSGDSILLAGYGCSGMDAKFRPLDDGTRRLRSAKSNVDKVLDTVFTTPIGGASQACPGDSGGPTYVVDSGKQLYLFGVNSAIARDKTTSALYTSVVRLDKGSIGQKWVKELLAKE